MLRVHDVMTDSPVAIGPERSVGEARALARAWSVHHLLVSEGSALLGVVCGCDLARANDDEPVSRHMQSPFVFVSPAVSIEVAAEAMLAQSVGCLPVLDELGALAGLVTRRDLRRAGALPGSPGYDACAACGETHGLSRPRRGGAVVFCSDCIERSSSGPEHSVTTLGGSD